MLEYIVKVYSQKGKTQTNLLVLNLKNIRVNHKLITFVCKNINVKRLELSLSKGDIGKYLKSQYLQQLCVSNTNFFSFLYVQPDNLSNLQQIFVDNCQRVYFQELSKFIRKTKSLTIVSITN